MIATHSQQSSDESFPYTINPTADTVPALNQQTTLSLLPNRILIHSPKAGLNPLVDHASLLLSVLSELKLTNAYRQLNKLQQELINEINSYHETVSQLGYQTEYLMVCRYILCATFDDIISHTAWGTMAQWAPYSLLAAFNQDSQHEDKFFTILERAIKEPTLYVDLMELIYICLSLGYKGQYRSTEYNQYQLEQITNNLYKHIRNQRGIFTKALSPVPLKMLKSTKKASQQSDISLLFIFFMTACMIMIIFISLDYLMDVISNEAYKNITHINVPIAADTVKK